MSKTDSASDGLAVFPMECPNCGAGLEISRNMELFTCTYCGKPSRAVWRGGTVSLISDAISKVQRGTDQTAAELALIRLNADLQKLKYGIDQLLIEKPAAYVAKEEPSMNEPVNKGLAAGALATLVALFTFDSPLALLAFPLAGGYFGAKSRSKQMALWQTEQTTNRNEAKKALQNYEHRMKQLLVRTRQIEEQIDQYRAVVDPQGISTDQTLSAALGRPTSLATSYEDLAKYESVSPLY